MKYERFEDLPVWRAAADLAAQMFPWTNQPCFRGMGDLANQLERASLSIANNIAEGFERGTTNELIQFLYYARGSAGEVRSMLCVMQRTELFKHLESQISDFKSQCESISRQIRAWCGSLQNSEITGQRHLNDQTRESYRRKERARVWDEQRREFMARKEEELKHAAQQRRDREGDDDADPEI